MEHLTIQAFINSQWIDIATLSFPNSEQGHYRLTSLDYEQDYALAELNKDDMHAVSINHPVSLFFDGPGWLYFLDDIMPSGAGRRYWLKYLDIEDLSLDEQNFILLKFGTIAPVGNLRVKESLPERSAIADRLTFTVDDVKNRAADFLDYAQHRDATAGGATGAGGEAPKLLLRCNDAQNIWIDTYQDDQQNQDLHYLVKYPRGSRSPVDCDILRAEYHYYHELAEMGFETIPTANMRLEEGHSYPSLWLPRFDIYFNELGLQRYAMESVYSILGKAAGVSLDHEQTIRALVRKITHSHMVLEQGYQFDIQAFVLEWVQRDLLNILFGNSDNHGRNTSFLKGDGWIKLAPIYDFAPMKADPEGVARTTKWQAPLEVGGEYDFQGIADALADLVPAQALMAALKLTAQQCLNLKQRLIERDVPKRIIDMPAIGFTYIEDKLTRWGLL
ncbi:type II toxin-antitoxin system HipA family toxin [Bowmanella yangjiangensis]|uniref:Type II toxin-antitoxin system HipA family toxin n=1 Tax=Bowmanella yangjiangensis TaxID=2811230 RepID=A0ABS3CUP4_9ALTE|nr:HipA domain-containing protein [Bowmanella yangjiangensis]MBN7820837.1 type II toxin-antitoxin system HipA family toxin [Bowmanella yangjiangensis]